MIKNENTFPGLPQQLSVTEPPTAEASQLKLFTTVTNRSWTSAGGGERRRGGGQTPPRRRHIQTLSNANTNSVKKNKEKKDQHSGMRTPHLPLHTRGEALPL